MKGGSNKMKAIILLSGGLDSAVAAAWAKKEFGLDCLALSFNYGQRHGRELKSAQQLAYFFGWSWRIEFIEIPAQSALTDEAKDVNRIVKGLPASFVPARNLIFLSYAAAYAWNFEATEIIGGWNTIDYSGYPDCRHSFLSTTENAINQALGLADRIEVLAPLIHKNKKEIVELGVKLKVPFDLTWSFYLGGKEPCRTCSSCMYRQKGFQEANVLDPLLKE